MRPGYQIARHHGLEPIVLEDLREVEVFRDIPPDRLAVDFVGRQLLLGIRQRMLNEKSWDVYPYSESSFDFRKRTVNAIEGILATHPGERIVVACHGGVINAYIGHIIGVDYDMFFRPAHTSVNVVLAGHGLRALALTERRASPRGRRARQPLTLRRAGESWGGSARAASWLPSATRRLTRRTSGLRRSPTR